MMLFFDLTIVSLHKMESKTFLDKYVQTQLYINLKIFIYLQSKDSSKM